MSKKKSIQQYKHDDKKRLNNPPIGLVNDRTDSEYGQNKKKYQYDPHLDPELGWDRDNTKAKANLAFKHLKEKIAEHEEGMKKLQEKFGEEAAELVQQLQDQHKDMFALMQEAESVFAPALKWTGKTEKKSFEVPTVNLHVHERIDPHAIIETVKKDKKEEEQLSMFETKRPLREAMDFYKHKDGWTNRLIAGDSLLVMNSLLEKEGMGGKVQMIYFDPPYGISYGSNFQPFVNKRNVTDGKDEDLTQEPEMIKAFRDTWELGIHSYLTYIRDRLLLAKDLLHESGSIFLQISDENVHHLRGILDEVFGKNNYLNIIPFVKTAGITTKFLASNVDFILWYAKDKLRAKYIPLYKDKTMENAKHYNWLELKDGTRRGMNSKEKKGLIPLPIDSRLYKPDNITSQGNPKFPFEYLGKEYSQAWKTSKIGLENLAKHNRLHVASNSLQYVRYFDDFPCLSITQLWEDTATGSFTDNKVYVVQTGSKTIQRCLLMTTDPGDLVLDITCGSGTTAKVAEQWGRRWITCDTSRVALTLAKQRLMTSVFEYYKLAHPNEGVGSGFKYKTVSHITLGQIANDIPLGEEVLYDQPLKDNKRTRITGPFTVESVPATMVKSLEETLQEEPSTLSTADTAIAREGETYRHKQWMDELANTGVRGKGGAVLKINRVTTLSGTHHLQAEGETEGDPPQKVLIVFGPEHAAMDARQVENAIEEARFLKPDILLFCAFQFDEEAAKDIDDTPPHLLGFKLLKVQMNMDLQTNDLKRKSKSNQSFWLIGQPDIRHWQTEDGKTQVEVKGFDYFNPKTGKVDSGGPKKIAMWMLDTDYDGRSLFPSQVFFPMAGAKDGWDKLAKALKAELDAEKIHQFKGTVSLPFEAGRKIAVKIIDDRGIESLKVIPL